MKDTGSNRNYGAIGTIQDTGSNGKTWAHRSNERYWEQREPLAITYLSKFDNVSIIVQENGEINTIARQRSNTYSVIVVFSCFYRIKRTYLPRQCTNLKDRCGHR